MNIPLSVHVEPGKDKTSFLVYDRMSGESYGTFVVNSNLSRDQVEAIVDDLMESIAFELGAKVTKA